MNMCKNAMRAAKTLLLVGALSLAFKGDSVQAETYKPSEDSQYSLIYENEGGEIWIYGYEGEDKGILEIPGQIDGLPVTNIYKEAFAYSGFRGVSIPDSVKEIGVKAFQGCEKLGGDLIIPDSVEKLGWGAFQYAGSFDSLVLSKNLKKIEDSTFEECGIGGDLHIPKGIEYIGEEAFMYSGLPGDLYIPNSVEYIGNWAFAYNDLKTLTVSLHENITFGNYFGCYTFCDAGNISEVRYLHKPKDALSVGWEGAVHYYPTHVDGWDEIIEQYPDVNWVAYEPSVVPFIQRMYQVALDRTADEGGLKSWVGELLSGNKTGAEVAFNFIFSNEFKEKNYCDEHYIKQLYKAFMGREYDEGGLNHWSGMMKAGTTREAVFNGFSQSDEFKGICENYGIELGAPIDEPLNGTVPTGPCVIDGKENGVVSFIKRLYKICLDRDADENGLSYWNGMLRRNECSGATAAHGFIFSQEFMAKNHSDADYIEYLYQAFMGRASEANGKAYWLERMASGEVTREDVFNGFAYSAEFVEICNGYGIAAY